MAIVVIGGHAKNIGKTGAVCGLISALPERRWTAIKITQHAHGELVKDGVTISEEIDRAAGTDSSRYLAAGAARAFWVRTGDGQLAEAMPRIQEMIAEADNVIVESNSVIGFLQPDVYAVVLDPDAADFKASSLRYLDRVDAILLKGETLEPNRWNMVSLKRIEDVPKFKIAPPSYCSAEFASFVSRRL